MDATRRIHGIDDRLEGRRRLGAAAPHRSPLTAKRLEQLRDRVRERAYDDDSVVAVTAREILGSRDL